MSNRFCYSTAAACVASVIAFAPHALAQLTPFYTVTKTVALGAPDRWDFVVFYPVSHKVFVAHGDRVTVVDGVSGTVIGNLEGLPGGTHGVAIVPGTGRGYTDDGKAGTAESFDLDKLTLIKAIKADASSIGTSGAGGKPETAVYSDNGKLYVNGEEKKKMLRIEAATNQI